MTAKPFLKWTGSKRQLVPTILSYLPARINTYREPFFGGGAVFFALANEDRFKHAVISDANLELITTLRAIRDDVESVIFSLRLMPLVDITNDLYTQVRATKPINDTVVAVRMIWLNKNCFNGLYRVNKRGEFNVAWGKRTTYEPDIDILRAVSRVLNEHNVDIVHSLVCQAASRPGDAIYLDSPYWPTSRTANFDSYTEDGFGPEQQERLGELFARYASTGATVIASNSDVPGVRQIYGAIPGVEIHEVSRSGQMNSDGKKRGRVGELLIVANGVK
jgi:DNA adenine methylase